ncbi:TIGR02996 domain-containing protein [Thalassoroseus pseudoceratinae]|uniref:TIGR02996 domain-containing protein n=1 Tax=Thalassoroseus pseudoceratinae TaxID=2713176 RepID=UPI001420E1B3|nr:TIGR02996 domain-containing protein [Thalassoroseus pseudoceratinae]
MNVPEDWIAPRHAQLALVGSLQTDKIPFSGRSTTPPTDGEMPQAEQFLREIRRQPDDTVPRLIYADWLEERGDARAELIRVQCELETHDDIPEDFSLALKARERELIADLESQCLADLDTLAVRAVRFRGGLVDAVIVEGDRFLQHGRILSRWAPALRSLDWRQMPRDAGTALRQALRSPFLSAVTELDLSDNSIGRSGIPELANARRSEQLRSLYVSQTRLAGPGMQELMRAALWSLERLDCSHNGLSPFDVQALTRSEQFAKLTTLDLSHNTIADDGLRMLSQWDRLRSLRDLNLSYNDIGPVGMKTLTVSEHMVDLDTLDLSGNIMHGGGIQEIASGSNFSRLSRLKLNDAGLEATDLTRLVRSPYLKRLTHLELDFNPLGELDPDIMQSPILSRLRQLSLRHTQLDNVTAREIAKSDAFTSIEQLDVRENPLIDSRTKLLLNERFGPRVQF